MKSVILATDLDGTLVGNSTATQEFNLQINDLRKSAGLKLVYATGRSSQLYEQLKEQEKLLTPDALITAVGTEIYIDDQILTEWPAVVDWDEKAIKSTLAGFTTLELQPSSEQRRYKISYFLNNDQQVVDEVKEALKHLPVSVVYSVGRYLDILPADIDKGSALDYLASRWRIPEINIVACGDSGNDRAMLESHKAIVVGNAKEELLNWARTKPQDMYIAKNNYAHGIIEGLKHYQVIV